MPEQQFSATAAGAINRAFSKQSHGYDEADRANVVLHDLRQQVYRHIQRHLKPKSHMLELNAGTGIDALFFVSQGHFVHATDLSDGMIDQINKKILSNPFSNRFTSQQLSFEELDKLTGQKFDYVFSNFGGLNCVDDLHKVARHLPNLLAQGGYVTWVIMPPICPWELMLVFKGKWSQAFRRLKKGGVMAHVEGEYFKTYYHSVNKIRSAFGDSFEIVQCEGLAALSPPPHRADLPLRYPGVYKLLRRLDGYVRNVFPFDRCADHVIVTFRCGA